MKTLALLLLLAGPAIASGPNPAAAAQAAEQADPTPAVVFLLRHAEKPVGADRSPDLNATGYERARLIPNLFVNAPGRPSRFPAPDALFATDASKHSNRPLETIAPLATRLHLPVDHSFTDPETGALAKKVLSGSYAGKIVVICWHHGEIPHLAQALGVTDAPKKWDPDTFDRIWEIRWVDGKAQMTILPEHLLPSDPAQ